MKTFEFTLSSTNDNLHNFELELLRILEDLKLEPSKINELSLAVIEAVGNAIRHGNKFDPNKFVKVKLSIIKDHINILVEDQGQGFDITKVDDPTKPENLLKTSGRGIYIMRNIMHNFEVICKKNRTIVKMSYYFNYDKGQESSKIVP